MPGQSELGALPPVPGLVGCVLELVPRQVDTACCSASHPANSAVAPEAQVGCMPSMQRRNAYACDAQADPIAGNCEQLDTQSASSSIPDLQPDCSMLSQMVAHEAETWAGEQLSPHEANGPPSSSTMEVVRPPQPVVDARKLRAAPKTMQYLFMAICQWWSRRRARVNLRISQP